MSKLNTYYGLVGSSRSWMVANLANQHKKIILINNNTSTLEDYLSDITFLNQEVPIVVYRPWETLPLELVSPAVDLMAERIHALHTIQSSTQYLCLTSVEAICQKILPTSFWGNLVFDIAGGKSYQKETIVKLLLDAGFQEVPLVQSVGNVAIRGNVIDFFPSTTKYPVRVEFLKKNIVTLRQFDSDSQRSLNILEQVKVLPVSEALSIKRDYKSSIEIIKERAKILETPLREVNAIIKNLEEGKHFPGIELLSLCVSSKLDTFFDCLQEDVQIILDEEISCFQQLAKFAERVEERRERLEGEQVLFPAPEKIFLTEENTRQTILSRINYSFGTSILDSVADETLKKSIVIQTRSNTELATRLRTLIGSGKALKPLKKALSVWRRHGFDIAFVVGAKARAERLQRALLEISIDAPIKKISGIQWYYSPLREPVVILEGQLNAGFALIKEKVIYIAESEVYPERSYRKEKTNTLSIKRILNSLAQLTIDDYIVHSDYGIGVYRGLKHLELDGVQGDFLHIDYADSRLYLPVHNIGKVQKFFAAEGQKPLIDKLGSQRWLKTKLKVRKAVIDLAGDLIKLYATRSIAKGWRFEPFGAEDERFADLFAFNETPDQYRTIQEVIADMALDKPMDRLVCGDVGFGKTEVAIRAAFKCVQHTRQVAVLVPTTILVEQHRATFESRFNGYSAKVAAVSRFYSKTKNAETLQELAKGEIDIIIGTHRLLQKDVVFSDLGLLVIDEEHRFGVKQKERLKQLKKQVDVLSLTATPIPRTLQMSLLDIRDTSVINTPPHDRRVIRTFVAHHSESILRDAILREIQRGGQCFYLHNRVQTIETVTSQLKELLPDIRFEFAHGQMSETMLENIMQRFIKHEVDVLVSTTIIESGLDIPNANTIIIEKAEMLGLAQLYQLRGRVGRGSRQAYCYFLISKNHNMTQQARQRLQVLESLDDLGLGFNLAIRDLEIRGAGNLLGKEQSGNVLSVGFELYSKILKEAVLNLKGQELPYFDLVDPEMKLGIPAYIASEYIPNVSERLIMYQRLSSLEQPQEADEIRIEIIDRFGETPLEVDSLIETMRLRCILRHFAVEKAEISKERLMLSFTARSPIDIQKLLNLVANKSSDLKFAKSSLLSISLSEKERKSLGYLYSKVVNLLNEIKA
jgi:transcription-repair coupling factor (superfamily II helicase)